MNNYNLEYSEKQGYFHQSFNGDIPSKNTKVIANNIEEIKIQSFCMLMFSKYPNLNNVQRDTTLQIPFPSFDTIKQEFIDFLKS